MAEILAFLTPFSPLIALLALMISAINLYISKQAHDRAEENTRIRRLSTVVDEILLAVEIAKSDIKQSIDYLKSEFPFYYEELKKIPKFNYEGSFTPVEKRTFGLIPKFLFRDKHTKACLALEKQFQRREKIFDDFDVLFENRHKESEMAKLRDFLYETLNSLDATEKSLKAVKIDISKAREYPLEKIENMYHYYVSSNHFLNLKKAVLELKRAA